MIKRKAQTELLGMAIVVLLISIGILFIISNALKKTTAGELKKEFSEKQLASNILGAVLSTTTNCQSERVSTLLIDCGKNQIVSCDPDNIAGTFIPGTDDACDYLNNVIDAMLSNTLAEWNRKYQFQAYNGGSCSTSENCINITHNFEKCIAGWQAETYYLPLHPGTMTVDIKIC